MTRQHNWAQKILTGKISHMAGKMKKKVQIKENGEISTVNAQL